MKKTVLLSLMLLASLPAYAQEPAAEKASYNYAHNDSEYSVMLPEAPRVVTIWGDGQAPVPYLDNPPKEGALGEIATFRRVDQNTEELFDVKITFLKTPPEFLSSLTEEKMKAALENDYKGIKLEGTKWHYAVAPNGLKWATFTGFNVDENSRPFYNASHYLTGRQSILVLKVKYSVENAAFADDYKMVSENITYLAQ